MRNPLLLLSLAFACADTTSNLDATSMDSTPAKDATVFPDAAPEDADPRDGEPADANDDAGTLEDAAGQDAGEGDASEVDADTCDDVDGDGRGPGCPLGDDCAPADSALFESMTLFMDADGDLATVGAAVSFCTDGNAPPGYAPQGLLDCDDQRADVYPGAAELSDCIDHDCDGERVPFGDGRDGSIVATATNTVTLASIAIGGASMGDTAMVVDDPSIWTSGDLALLVGMQGPDAGQFGLYRIAGTTTVSVMFDAPVRESWSVDSLTYVVRVAQYRDVRVPAGTTIEASRWIGPNQPGAAGSGIIAWAVSGRLTIETGAAVSASGACHPGGRGSTIATQIGEQGTSYDGVPIRSRSANFSGGGGGSSPSLTNACGGGGGHVTQGGMGQNHPGFNAQGGFGGGTVGTSTTVISLDCGGGGGAGGLDADPGPNSHGGDGGAGGGIVFIMTRDLDLSGSILADGASGSDGVYFGAASPGGGGGGAGGTIFVAAATVTAGLGNVSAIGGMGGRGSEAGAGNYRGGTGGEGRIVLDVAGAVSVTPAPISFCP